MRNDSVKTAVLVVALALTAGLLAILLLHLSRRSEDFSLQFDGSNRVEISSTPALEFSRGPFTASLWFRTTTTNQNITFISKRADALLDGWGVFGQGDHQFLFYSAGCASPMSTPQPYRDGRWHHLLVVREPGRVEIFYDGTRVVSGPEQCDYRDHHPLLIGMDGRGGGHFSGEISEVHLYNVALTADQITQEWNGGRGARESVAGDALVAGYHFDETAGTVTRDFSGRGHHGTLINFPGRVAIVR
jgi:hypothetical protein